LVGAVRAGGDRGSDQWQRFFPATSPIDGTFQELTPNRLESNSDAAIPQPLRAPNVDSKQLFRHVKALNFKRYTR